MVTEGPVQYYLQTFRDKLLLIDIRHSLQLPVNNTKKSKKSFRQNWSTVINISMKTNAQVAQSAVVHNAHFALQTEWLNVN